MKKKEIRKKTIFVLDTNVILHNPECFKNFAEHDIVIPTIVLEEIDTFKTGNLEKNHNARQFIRSMDEFRIQTVNGKSALSNGGVSLGPDKGVIKVEISGKSSEYVRNIFPEIINDNRILSLVYEMSQSCSNKVVLVTKDVSLRIKADVLGVCAEDYENDKKSFEGFTGRAKANYPFDKINDLYTRPEQIADDMLLDQYPEGIPENTYFILNAEDKKTALARYNSGNLIHVKKEKIFGIEPRNSEQAFSLDALVNESTQLVCLSGKAGTGKTLMAIASGLKLLKEQKIAQIIISAATVPLGNKEIGFLPGDAQDKVSPYMQGLFDNLAFIKRQLTRKEQDWIELIQKEEKLVIQPLASIRGRSINDTFFVIDESQNLTPHEIKTIVTRAGQNTKIVFCGDVTQIDSPYLDAYSNGLSHLIVRMTNQILFAHITLEKGERSGLSELAATIL